MVHPDPSHPQTKGEVWPKPQFMEKDKTIFVYKSSQFHIKTINNTCDILTRAIERYSFTLRKFQNITRQYKERNKVKRKDFKRNVIVDVKGDIKELQIDMRKACEQYPYLGMDESYELSVDQTSILRSKSIWGVLRGLESFSHLFYLTDDYSEVRINRIRIFDYPRYQHRGLLLDTSRHFVSLKNILKTLDAMSMNKMNVFHWHIVDHQSFPYESEKFPKLSARGAYHHTLTYKKSDIDVIIKYATDRGIRVIPEFDVPGHTRSWGKAYPDILTKCYNYKKVVGLGPMDPTKNATYALLRDLISEVQQRFPDKYFHVGGDEVELGCWSSNPNIRKYMKKYNMESQQLHALFMKKLIPLLQNKSIAIVWQEVFDEGVQLGSDVLVQVWKLGNHVTDMINVLKSGHKVIFSASWYLDHLDRGWTIFYAADPRSMVFPLIKDYTWLANIIGGEACMWTEMVNNANLISRVWPRACAVAERLWSSVIVDNVSDEAELDAAARLEEHTCRMSRRGVAAQPANGPGFCITENDF